MTTFLKFLKHFFPYLEIHVPVYKDNLPFKTSVGAQNKMSLITEQTNLVILRF